MKGVAALTFVLAGLLYAEPKCPQLVSAQPAALVSYLDDSEKVQTPGCIEYAIRQIGDQRYEAGVDALIRHLGFRREPEPWEEPHGGAVVELMHEWYPATIALFQIGKPALPALVDLLSTETAPIVREKAQQTVMDISRDDFPSAVTLLRASAAKQRDRLAQDRLIEAARGVVKRCPDRVRSKCEAAFAPTAAGSRP